MVINHSSINKYKIAVVTGTRAEYGLLYLLMREIQQDPELELQIIATGMHLSPEFGLTYQLIEADGFHIDTKVEMLMSSDSTIGVAKSVGLGVISFADVFARMQPDIIILLGDRFESLAVAQVALIQKIPLAHIHGGELSEGAIDDAIRHTITKMSHLHFVAAESYRRRVIQLGENPQHVHNVGAPGLERITRMKLLNKNELEKNINIRLSQCNFLVTYHPATLAVEKNLQTLHAIFEALDQFPQATIIFTRANADEMGRLINSEIDKYVSQHKNRVFVFTTLGDLNYLSLIQFVEVVIGNSSSGIIEVPYFRKPTINIGYRQNKRLRASSIIDIDGSDATMVVKAINRALSNEFKAILHKTISPYYQDKTANKIKNIIKQTDFKQLLLKRFNDLDIPE